LEKSILKINDVLANPELMDFEAVLGLLLCECRMIYNNKKLCEAII